MGSMAKMSQGSMAMQSAHGAMQGRPGVPYAQLRSVKPSSIAASHPRREITLRLTGDMTRYIWSFNGKTLAEDSTIPVSKGEVLRIHLINDTMMHHPLHLHGHFFRLINGQGSHAPLKHTVDVAPMGKRTIEFLANEEGDWFFHCHLLYHMDAGMARVFSYKKAIDPSHQPSLDAAAIEPSFLFIHGDILTNMTMGSAMMMRGREDFGFMWEYSFDHKDYENDIFWGHYFNPNLNSMLGYRFTNGHHEKDRIFAQVNYRLPYLVESSLQLDSEGDVRLGLGKEFQLTPRVSAYGTLEYDTNTDFMWESGISYLLSKQWSLTGIYHTQHGFGVGCSFRF